MSNTYKKLSIVLLLLTTFSLNAQTTVQDYLDEETVRIAKADSINQLIDNYIATNLPSYNLSQSEIDDITDDLTNVHDGSSNPITGSEFDSIVKEVKRLKLRNQYYQQNASDTIFFVPTPIPSQLRQLCFNGGFENGIASYSFRQTTVLSPFHIDDGCLTDDSLTSLFNPSGTFLNNYTASATLVSPGNEPYLLNLSIFINKVLTGNRAIKLNPSSTIGNNQTGNRVSMSRTFTINENYIEFSFLLFGHSTIRNRNNPHEDPFFRYRLLDSYGNELFEPVCYSIGLDDCRFNTIEDPTLGNDDDDLLTYTPDWVCERINTSEWLNQEVTLEFYVSDCQYRGHFSTVYIDNICGVSCKPSWGYLNLTPYDDNCPNSDINICGEFGLPVATNQTSFILSILDADNNVVSTINNPNINEEDFCFSVSQNDFGDTLNGPYSFKVTLENDSSCNDLEILTDSGGVITFDNCATPDPCDPSEIEFKLENGILTWTDIGDLYEIVFDCEDSCCKGYENSGVCEISNFPEEFYLLSTNSIDIADNVLLKMQVKCFRFHLRAFCNGEWTDWTDWCCINAYDLTIPPEICYPSLECENYYDITLTPSENITTGTINYDTHYSIIAYNVISSGATSLYQANETIRLLSGFHAEAGSEFNARIALCEFEMPNLNKVGDIKLIKSNELKVFPNPASQELNIKTNVLKSKSFVMYNLSGQIIFKNEIVTNDYIINVSEYNRGYYILKIQLEDNSVTYKNIILN